MGKKAKGKIKGTTKKSAAKVKLTKEEEILKQYKVAQKKALERLSKIIKQQVGKASVTLATAIKEEKTNLLKSKVPEGKVILQSGDGTKELIETINSGNIVEEILNNYKNPNSFAFIKIILEAANLKELPAQQEESESSESSAEERRLIEGMKNNWQKTPLPSNSPSQFGNEDPESSQEQKRIQINPQSLLHAINQKISLAKPMEEEATLLQNLDQSLEKNHFHGDKNMAIYEVVFLKLLSSENSDPKLAKNIESINQKIFSEEDFRIIEQKVKLLKDLTLFTEDKPSNLPRSEEEFKKELQPIDVFILTMATHKSNPYKVKALLRNLHQKIPLEDIEDKEGNSLLHLKGEILSFVTNNKAYENHKWILDFQNFASTTSESLLNPDTKEISLKDLQSDILSFNDLLSKTNKDSESASDLEKIHVDQSQGNVELIPSLVGSFLKKTISLQIIIPEDQRLPKIKEILDEMDGIKNNGNINLEGDHLLEVLHNVIKFKNNEIFDNPTDTDKDEIYLQNIEPYIDKESGYKTIDEKFLFNLILQSDPIKKTTWHIV